MRVLIIHPEARSFAGAERVLEYFLQGMVATGNEITVAVAADTKCASIIPKQFGKILVPDNGRFSLLRLCQQLVALRHYHRHGNPFALVHGWAARDWELTGLLGWAIGRPAIGTLHDHPRARFISKGRQNLMRWSAQWGLKNVACVSQAVRDACLEAGYIGEKLRIVRNGLPPLKEVLSRDTVETFRMGFLGLFSERKGMRVLFEILDRFADRTSIPWELHLAGDALDEAGRQLVAALKRRFAAREWWGRVQWHGWLNDPKQFLAGLSLLLFASSEFDPFPTVLLESSQLGVPALAAHVGGVAEIIADEQTGWLFDPADALQAVAILERLIQDPMQCRRAGDRARQRTEQQFPMTKMVTDYLKIYRPLLTENR